jgi:hypothetical protein
VSDRNFNPHKEISITARSGAVDWRKFAQGPALEVDDSIKLMLTDKSFSFTNTHRFDNFMEKYIQGFQNTLIGGAIVAGQAWKNSAEGGIGETFNPWYRNMKSWQGSEPLTIALKFDFKIGQYGIWNAKHEVVKPMLQLMIPGMVQSISAASMQGPAPSTASMAMTLVRAVGSNILSGDIANTISNAALGLVNVGTFDIIIGKALVLRRMYCTSMTPSFGTRTDKEGYSVDASISLNFESAMPLAVPSAGSLSETGRFFSTSLGTAGYRSVTSTPVDRPRT